MLKKLNHLVQGVLMLSLMFVSGIAQADNSSVSPNQAKMISAIEVEGNRFIESAAVMAKLDSKVGTELNRKTISRDVRKLFKTGSFADVHVEGFTSDKGVRVVFVVKENPLVSEMEILGNDEIVDKDLKPKMKLKAGRILSPAALRSDKNAIRKAYLKKGYYQVNVLAEQEVQNDGRIKLILNVKEGEVTRIKRIRFIGNKAFSDDELRDKLASKESSFMSWFSSRDVFDRERFGADGQLLSQYYLEHGYLDMKTESNQLSLTPDKESFYLTFSLFEGPQYTVEGIEVQGDTVPSKEALMEVVELKNGEIYSLSALRKTIEAMTRLVGDEGYAFANVTPLFQRNVAAQKVAITFDIEKGREVYIERIEITGNDKTEDQVLRRELRQFESSRYNATNVERSKERLKRTRLLKDIRVSLPKTSAEDRVDMKIDVEEDKTGSFSFGLGFSQVESVFATAKVEERNFLGKGYTTNLSADMGANTKNYSVNLIDPYFLGSDMSASVSAFKKQTKLQEVTSYDEDNIGFGIGLGIPLSEFLYYSINYNFTETNLSGIPTTASIFVKAQEGKNTTGELTQAVSWDTRDRTVAATKGHLEQLSIGVAGLGGDARFAEVSATSKAYFSLNDDLILNPSINALYIKGFSGKDVPIYRRYSLGGIGSLRGFDSFGVTLRDPTSGDVVGGDKELRASLNLFFPIPYMKTGGFRGVMFVDGGTVWGSANTTLAGQTLNVAEAFSTSKIRSTVGVGLEWASPVGPIALVWGFPIKKQANDKIRTFEFGLGVGF
ncbi:MAG: outer membrane protein assembly factor BamA [Mariprofundaceae bacterium]